MRTCRSCVCVCVRTRSSIQSTYWLGSTAHVHSRALRPLKRFNSMNLLWKHFFYFLDLLGTFVVGTHSVWLFDPTAKSICFKKVFRSICSLSLCHKLHFCLSKIGLLGDDDKIARPKLRNDKSGVPSSLNNFSFSIFFVALCAYFAPFSTLMLCTGGRSFPVVSFSFLFVTLQLL